MLFGAQTALKHIDSSPACSAGSHHRRPRVGSPHCEEKLTRSREEMNAQLPGLSVFWVSVLTFSSLPINTMGLTGQRNGILK